MSQILSEPSFSNLNIFPLHPSIKVHVERRYINGQMCIGEIYMYDLYIMGCIKLFRVGCSIKSNDFITSERFCGSHLTVF